MARKRKATGVQADAVIVVTKAALVVSLQVAIATPYAALGANLFADLASAFAATSILLLGGALECNEFRRRADATVISSTAA